LDATERRVERVTLFGPKFEFVSYVGELITSAPHLLVLIVNGIAGLKVTGPLANPAGSGAALLMPPMFGIGPFLGSTKAECLLLGQKATCVRERE
jgi:hypothetical protein